MKVNGKEKALRSEISLSDYLESENYNLSHIAVELNGEIIRKESYSQKLLTDTDTLEIVQFMGGGGEAPTGDSRCSFC